MSFYMSEHTAKMQAMNLTQRGMINGDLRRVQAYDKKTGLLFMTAYGDSFSEALEVLRQNCLNKRILQQNEKDKSEVER